MPFVYMIAYVNMTGYYVLSIYYAPCALLGTLKIHYPISLLQQFYGKDMLCSYFIDEETEA